jgi:hypothetical protein
MVLRIAVALTLLLPMSALAGPGGKIASAAFRTTWGRVLLVLLGLVLLPFIAYVVVKEWRAEKRTLADLRVLGSERPEFDWLTLRDRAVECFTRVHEAWRREDMQQASQWMTGWYWQNQQLAHLDRWEREGLVNVCSVHEVKRVRPLFLACRNEDGRGGGSRLVVAFTAQMEDYLVEREGHRVVEGKEGVTEVTNLWTFVLRDGRWLVNAIEPDSLSLVYARMGNQLEALLAPAAVAGRTAR